MKKRLDLVRGWLQKAESDLAVVGITLTSEAFDAACFHAQQAAEKYLKAFLIHMDADFPLTHDLVRLVELCSDHDSSFQVLLPVVQPVTRYAVELRYNTDYWASKEDAEQAHAAALEVRAFMLSRLPKEVRSE